MEEEYKSTTENKNQLYNWCVKTYPKYKFSMSEECINVKIGKNTFTLVMFSAIVFNDFNQTESCGIIQVCENPVFFSVNEGDLCLETFSLMGTTTRDFKEAKSKIKKNIYSIEHYKEFEKTLYDAYRKYEKVKESIYKKLK